MLSTYYTVMHGYVTSYPLTSRLKTRNIFYYIASLFPKAQHGFTEYLWLTASHRATVKVLPGVPNWERISSELAHWQNSAFCGLLDLLALGQRHHFLAMWTSVMGSIQHSSRLPYAQESERGSKMEAMCFCILILEIVLHLLCHSLSLRSSLVAQLVKNLPAIQEMRV